MAALCFKHNAIYIIANQVVKQYVQNIYYLHITYNNTMLVAYMLYLLTDLRLLLSNAIVVNCTLVVMHSVDIVMISFFSTCIYVFSIISRDMCSWLRSIKLMVYVKGYRCFS